MKIEGREKGWLRFEKRSQDSPEVADKAVEVEELGSATTKSPRAGGSGVGVILLHKGFLIAIVDDVRPFPFSGVHGSRTEISNQLLANNLDIVVANDVGFNRGNLLHLIAIVVLLEVINGRVAELHTEVFQIDFDGENDDHPFKIHSFSSLEYNFASSALSLSLTLSNSIKNTIKAFNYINLLLNRSGPFLGFSGWFGTISPRAGSSGVGVRLFPFSGAFCVQPLGDQSSAS
nr:hypothetical protein Iba_chr03cCG6080 [Ipomoea batatas]